MAKLSKKQNAEHNKILDLIHSDKVLTYDEKVFIYENYNESATVNVREYAAFHTPMGLAWDVTIDLGKPNTLVDLCAGTGILSFCYFHKCAYDKMYPRIICVELVEDYVKLGKRLLPEAEWICADALTYDVLQHSKNRRKFDAVISNPPFGNIKTSKEYKPKIYTGADFEFKLIERARDIAHSAVLIVPQGSAPFKYSGSRFYQDLPDSKAAKFVKQTNIFINAGCGIDTSFYKDEWKNTKVLCEVLDIEYNYNIEMKQGWARMDNKLKFIRDTDENFAKLPSEYVDFIFTEMDFESVSKRYKELERIMGRYGKFQHYRMHKDRNKEDLKQIIENFTVENQTVFHYGVYDTLLAKICLKLNRKYIGIAGDAYDSIRDKFKELKSKYDPKPKKKKEKLIKQKKVQKSKKKKKR